jgi:mono/diheme cytochrome c family protein
MWSTRLLFTGWLMGSVVGVVAAAEAPLTYNRDIRPILVDKCFACHGPDSAARKADLRLDQRDQAVERSAIVPGNPDGSEMLRRILSTDPDEQMPPPVTKKTLSAVEIAKLRQWIAQGAEYQPHWSYIAPVRPELPPVRQMEWVRNPIDRFILARLEALGLSPAPEADRRTLARRLSLDLIGLPPRPEDVEKFVQDASPEAYEQYVDSLLSSPHWGEHRARYWLDAARYADTHGIHFDNYREIWAYRDWVINAFNRNLPFDQFTIEQLAGDMLPNPTLDQLIASGFNRCHITTNEGGIIDEEYLVLYTRDRTETTSQVWMGITMNCAVCHEHKFDPISQKEFYELAAFFNNTTVPARDGNIKDSPPVIVVPLPPDRERWQQLADELPRARQAVNQRKEAARPVFDQWLAAADPESIARSLPTEGLAWHIPADEGTGEQLTVMQRGAPQAIPLLTPARWQTGHVAPHALELNGGAVAALSEAGDFDADQPFSCAAWVRLAPNDSSGALLARMDDGNDFRGWDMWVEGRRVGMHLIHQWPTDALKVVTQKQLAGNEWTHVAITYDGSRKAAGVKIYVNGELQPTNVQVDTLRNTTRTAVPLKIGQRHSTSPLAGAAIQDIRLYDRGLSPAEAASLARSSRLAALLGKPADQRTPAEINELYDWWLNALDAEYRSAVAAVQQLEREHSDIKARGTVAYVLQERNEPPTAFVLFRGDYDKRREQVAADTPDFLPPFPPDLPRNRLGLAHWLLRPEHPLTARVTVNRFWQEVFGAGLVRTAGDFGVAGELPSHPELLDWLAVEFREQGWDVRKFFKLLVTSATYRQAAITTPQKLELDPQNRWLSRGPRFRMDAEMVRDYALTVSNLLVPKIGGPSVKPFQPDGLWEAIAMNVSNTRSYQRDVGEGSHRRSLYTFWKRQVPPAQMEIFNAPNREYCVVRRERTNTPLQALVTLNDPQFVEAAKGLAQLTLLEGGATDAARMDYLGRRLLARPFRSDETAVALSSLQSLLAYYQGHLEDARQLLAVGDLVVDPALDPALLAAWTMLANELMNLDEVLNK